MDDINNGRGAHALPEGLKLLTWDTKLKDILLDLKLMDQTALQLATLRDAMSHMTGLAG
jgi:hypothetical protein